MFDYVLKTSEVGSSVCVLKVGLLFFAKTSLYFLGFSSGFVSKNLFSNVLYLRNFKLLWDEPDIRTVAFTDS